MSPWNVYVTRRPPGTALQRLAEHCKVDVNQEDRVLTREELARNIQGKDAILCLLTDSIDADLLSSAEQTKIIANYAVGFDNIDVKAASESGIFVTNTPDVLDNTTADFAWTLLMATARRIPEADTFTKAGNFKGWSPTLFLGQEITGSVLGIIGAGRIGRAMAKKAKAFDMRVIYSDISRNDLFERETGGTFVEMTTLLREADYISLHVPLTPKTRHLISSPELTVMKKSAIIINTSRGPVIDEEALAQGLQTGEIWGAGLDVFENEPAITEALVGLPNVVLAPHIASASTATRAKMADIAVNNILAAKRGEIPPNCLNYNQLKR